MYGQLISGLSTNWNCLDNCYPRLSFNWNCPDNWFSETMYQPLITNCPNNWFRRLCDCILIRISRTIDVWTQLSIQWKLSDTWFSRQCIWNCWFLETRLINWNCPNHWLRRMSTNWKCLNNWFRVLCTGIDWNCLDGSWARCVSLDGIVRISTFQSVSSKLNYRPQ